MNKERNINTKTVVSVWIIPFSTFFSYVCEYAMYEREGEREKVCVCACVALYESVYLSIYQMSFQYFSMKLAS